MGLLAETQVIWSLDAAHPAHRLMIRDIVGDLMLRWPQAPLKEVRVYEPRKDDLSLGNADHPGVIELNGFWFGQPPEVLEEHAMRPRIMPLGGGKMIAWHGPMDVEPAHLLHHEMGHVVASGNPRLRSWARERWALITSDPVLALTGYEMADADECSAENFALFSLGLMPPALAAEFAEIVG